MNTQIGKSFGIALLLAAGLLAALFAMGVFSPTGVGAQGTPPAFVETDDSAAFTAAVAENKVASPIIEAADAKYSFHLESGSAKDAKVGSVQVTGHDSTKFDVGFSVAGSDLAVMKVSADKPTNVLVLAKAFTDDKVISAQVTATFTKKTDGVTDTNPPSSIKANVKVIPVILATAGTVPGANERLTIKAMLAANSGDRITVDLEDFGVPPDIASDEVRLANQQPSDVDVSGSTVTLYVGRGSNDNNIELKDTNETTIIFRKGADITLPVRHGTYDIGVFSEETDEETAAAALISRVMVERTISISPEKGGSGTEITVTGKGFTDGEATVFIDAPNKLADDVATDVDETKIFGMFDSGDPVLGRADIVDGAFTFKTTKVTADATINAHDTNDEVASAGKDFTVTNSISVSPTELSLAETLTITLKDWPDNARPTRVTFTGGHSVDTTSSGTADKGFVDYDADDGSLEVKVPSGVASGTATVKVYVGSSLEGSADITITALSLSVSPSMAVPGQQITIQGSGFAADDCIEMIKVGGKEAYKDTCDSGKDENASSAGNIVISVDVPSPEDGAIGDGTKTVSLTAESGRKGEASIEIPEAAITLDPAESRRGSSVTVSASGFPAGDLIQIKYGGTSGRTVAAGTTDTIGSATFTFTVPSNANIGKETTVAAESTGNYGEVTATASHSTPGATVSVEPAQVVSGGNVTIKGDNLPASVAVSIMEINGIDVRPVPSPHTGANGSFEATVLVPQLDLGNQRVYIKVDESTPTTFIEVIEAPVSQVPAELFADLGARLLRVWEFDNDSQTWSFYDPRPDFEDFNSLTEVSSGDIATIIISSGAPIAFQGTNLYPGGTSVVVLK